MQYRLGRDHHHEFLRITFLVFMGGVMFVTTLTLPTTALSQEPNVEVLNYDLRLVPRSDRTDMVVTLNIRMPDRASLTIGLPKDTAFGTPDLSSYVTNLHGLHGTKLRPGPDASARFAQPGSDGKINIEYTLSFPPDVFGSLTYAPNTGPGHWHCAGAQWLLRIGDLSEPRSYIISLRDAPAGWHTYSSLGPNPARIDVKLSHKRLARSTIGGVSNGFSTFATEQSPVSVFIAPDFADRRAAFGGAIESIVRAQRKAFDDYSSPFFNVVVLPRPQNIAGIKVGQQFTCFVKPDVTMHQLTVLLSHEMMHTWITDAVFHLGPVGERSENFVRNMWFIEGVNEHLSRTILMKAGLLSRSEFAALVNRDLINLADNQHRHETFDQVMQSANAGKFGVAYTKLSYYRGALIALNWEARLRAAKSDSTVLSVIRSLYQRAKREATISYDDFFADLDSLGMNARRDFDRHILNGLPIEPRHDALGNGFELRATEVPLFEPGFAIGPTERAGLASGVVDGSAAHQAGLREGAPVLSIENATRFSNAWDPNAPLVVVVEENGAERRIAFIPHGAPRTLNLFHSR